MSVSGGFLTRTATAWDSLHYELWKREIMSCFQRSHHSLCFESFPLRTQFNSVYSNGMFANRRRKIHFSFSLMKRRCWIVNDGEELRILNIISIVMKMSMAWKWMFLHFVLCFPFSIQTPTKKTREINCTFSTLVARNFPIIWARKPRSTCKTAKSGNEDWNYAEKKRAWSSRCLNKLFFASQGIAISLTLERVFFLDASAVWLWFSALSLKISPTPFTATARYNESFLNLKMILLTF